jgi:polyhydroxybutyrate depolymerase
MTKTAGQICFGLVLTLLTTSAVFGQSRGVWDARSSGTSSNSNSSQNNYSTNRGGNAAGSRSATQDPRLMSRTKEPLYGNPASQRVNYASSQHANYSGTPGPPRGNYANTRQTSPRPGARLLDYDETVNGRTYLVHLPQKYNAAAPPPVVIVFHGLGMDGTSVRGLSAMDITAERNNFITVYPDALGRRWNDGVQPNTGVDDVAFVSDMLNAMAKKFKYDSRRVYACGISNGGYFVQKLACELPSRIAAIGVVASTASESVCARCNMHRSMPVVLFLGTDDPLIPREGETKELGKLGDALGLSDLGVKSINSTVAKYTGVMSAVEVAEFWAKNNGCSAHPRVENLPDRDTRDGCRVSRETFSGGSEVVVYTIEGGGHSWPGGMGFVAKDIIGRTTDDISASDIMWQFFSRYSR